jgi:hypothetical protein
VANQRFTKKLFEVSEVVLKAKKGRILGACYSEYLKNGIVYDHNLREVKL